MQLPPTVCAEFDDHKLELIERQTNAVVKPLRFPEIEIGGTDLAVTLAMSLLEEMSTVRDGTAAMDTDSDVAWSQPACIPPSTPGTRRLSTTLEKALSQHTDGVCRMSDYLQTPATVKRVLLHCLTDINEDINDDINDDEYAFSDDLTIPDADSRGYEEGESQEQMASVVTSTEADFMVRQHDYLHHFGASLGYNKEVVADAIQLIDERTQLIEFISHLSTLKHITGIGDQMPEDDQDVMIIETGTVNLTDDENGVVDLTGEENKSIIDLTDDVGEEDHETSEYIHTVLPDNYKTRLLRDIFQDDSKCSFDERKHQSAERQKVYEMLKLQQPSPQPPPPRAQHTSPKSQHPPRQPEPQKARRQLLHPPPQPQKKMPQPQKSASQLQPAPQLQPQPQEPEQQDRQPTRPTAGDKAAKNSKSTAEKQEAAKSDQPHNFPNRMYKNIKQKPTEAVVPRSASGELSRSQDIPSLVRAANQTEKDELRYIVIDGSNVAMSHGNNRHFSCKGLRICVDYFKQRGHTKITAFVPHWRGARHNNVITDQEILAQLRDEDCLVFTPSRRIRHKLVAAYDDRFILELAEVEDGIIVSNDQYRDLMNEKASWKNIIEERLLMFSFVKDWFMAPSDPLGRSGPSLDTFLRKKQPPRASRPGEPLSNYKQQTYPANQVSQFNHQKGQGYNRDYNHGQRQGEGRLAMYDRRRGYDQTY